MTSAPIPAALTYSEYLDAERSSGVRHEFMRGRIWAMTGGTPAHSAVKTALTALVYQALRGTPCRPYDSDLKIRVEAHDIATYPDLSVICGPMQTANDDPNAATNPVALFEVLSVSTEAWDRGRKFDAYRTLATLQHYVLIQPAEPHVEVFSRNEDKSWTMRALGVDDTLELSAVSVRIPVADLYESSPDSSPEDEPVSGPMGPEPEVG